MPPSPTPFATPPGALVPDVRRIAVLRANGIGDFVVAVPALHALRTAYPDAEITYLGAPWHPTLLAGRPGAWDRVSVVPRYPGVLNCGDDRPGAVDSFLAGQRARRYDLAVQLYGGGTSNPLVAALGARVTAGSADRGVPPLDRSTPYAYYQHEVLRFLEVVALVGAVPVELEPRLQVTAADRAAADAVLGAGDPAARSLVAIHPGASDPRRRWPSSSFAAVADVLAGAGTTVLLVGHGADDERAAGEIEAATSAPAVNLVGRLSMPAMVGVLGRCRLLVGNDSGPRHLAAAVGAATVGIYWCGNVINAGPLTRARHRIGVSFRSNCPVCGADSGRGRCPHDPSFVADVPVEEIAEAAIELFGPSRTDVSGRSRPRHPTAR